MTNAERGTQFMYPHSEPELETWEQLLLSEGPTTIVKLAFKPLNDLFATPLGQAAANNNFDEARSSTWAVAEQMHGFLSSRRHATTNGHRFVRIHATSAGVDLEQVARQDPPHPQSVYWRAVSMLFTHLNGPLTGEETYAIPRALDREVGLSRQSDEVIVLLDEKGDPRGASTVQYNLSRTRVAKRQFFHRGNDIVARAGEIANALLSRDDLATMRLPVAQPPASVQDNVGIRALPLPYIQPTGFDELLPAAFREG